MKTNEILAKMLKLLSAVTVLILLAGLLSEGLPGFFRLTRPCAFYLLLEYVALGGLAVLFTISSMPAAWRKAHLSSPNRLFKKTLTVILFGVFGNTVALWLQYDFISRLHFRDWYYISDFALCIFFIALFVNCYFNRNSRIFPAVMGVTYIAITLLAEYYGPLIYGLYRNGMVLIVLLITTIIGVFPHPYRLFTFSPSSENGKREVSAYE